jgi:iron(III) transport system permease protein
VTSGPAAPAETPLVAAAPPEGVPRRRRVRAPVWLWIPALVALIPTVVPFGFLVGRVFAEGTAAARVVLSANTARLVWNTSLLIVLVVASTAVIGVAAAWLTERTDLPGRRMWRVAVALPLVIPSYVIAMALLSATGPTGLIEQTLGIALPSLVGFPGAWVALTLATYPFVYLSTATALRRMDPAHEEAARGLGASQTRVFRTIVIPQLRPSLGAGLLLVALYTLSDFGAVSLVRFDSFTRVVYAQYAGRLDRTPAAVLAVLLVLVALVVVWAERATRGRAAYHGRPVRRPARIARLSPGGRLASLLGLATLALVSLGVPIGTLVGWLGRGTGTGRPFPWGAVGGSVAGSLMAAALVAALALPTAVLVTRHASRRTAWVEKAAYTVFALPHITVGLAVVFFASRYLGGFYQSLTVLVLVYGSIFFAQALGAARASLLQVSPSVEEVSRSLGVGPLKTMLRVTAPMVRRGIVAGSLLVFLTTMKELPATLLLRPTGFDTLAVGIWSAADSLLYSRAAAPALLLIAVSAIPMYLLATRER